jgi:hypothetical protein
MIKKGKCGNTSLFNNPCGNTDHGFHQARQTGLIV